MEGTPQWRFDVWSAVALAVLLCFSIVTDAVRERWAVSVFQAGVFGLAIVWTVWTTFRPYRVRGSMVLIPLGGAVVWGLLQLITHQTVYRFDTWNAVLGWATNFVIFFLSLQVLAFIEIRQAFRKSLLSFGFALSVVSVIQFFTPNGKVFWLFPAQYAEQALGPFVNRDHYASFVALLLPLALDKILTERKRAVGCAAVAGAMFASVIAGASRAGSILVTLEIAVLLVPSIIGRTISLRTPLASMARITFFAVVFTAVVGWEVLWERFQDPDPFLFRREVFYSSLSMIRDRPWTGFGLGAWPTAYPAYALLDIGAFVNHAHCDWVEWTAEGGVPLLAMLLWIFIWGFRSAIRFPWGAGVVAVFLHSLVDFPLQKPALAALMFVLLAALAASTNDQPAGRGPAE
jgi:O-antigen ligase